MGGSQGRKQPGPPPGYTIDVEEDDRVYDTRSPSSSIIRSYKQPVLRDTLEDPVTQPGPFVQRRRASMSSGPTSGAASRAVVPVAPIMPPLPRPKSRPEPAPAPKHHQKGRNFTFFALCVGMLIMGGLVFGLTTLRPWIQTHLDDLQYGRPRTFHLAAVLGHNDSQQNKTDLLFINLNRHIEIIEFPGGDAAHPHVYTGPVLFGDGQDLTPVTATIHDVNGDGKPDLIVHIQDQRFVLINTGTGFRPLQPGEQVTLDPSY